MQEVGCYRQFHGKSIESALQGVPQIEASEFVVVSASRADK
jgi:hypothetical protein